MKPLYDAIVDLPELTRNGENAPSYTTRVVALHPKGWTGKPGPVLTEKLVSDLTWHMRALDREQMLLILLDDQRRLIGLYDAFRGGPGSVHVHAGQVLTVTLLLGAREVVLVHNHPSGNPRPSGDDYATTAVLWNALPYVGARLRYHYVVGAEGFSRIEGLDRNETKLAPQVRPTWAVDAVVDEEGFSVPQSYEPFGKYKKYLVSSALTRKPTILTRISSSEHLHGMAEVWRKWEPTTTVLLYAIDFSHRLLATQALDEKDPSAEYVGRAALLLQLLSGGAALLITVLGAPSEEKRVVRLAQQLPRWFQSLPWDAASLVDVVAYIDGQPMRSSASGTL